MKKLLLLLICFFSIQNTFAQSKAETWKWLNDNRFRIYAGFITSNIENDVNNRLEFDGKGVKLISFRNPEVNILWSNIKDVKIDSYTVTIYSNEISTVENQNVFIRLLIMDDDSMRKKYFTAIKEMATLKGPVLKAD